MHFWLFLFSKWSIPSWTVRFWSFTCLQLYYNSRLFCMYFIMYVFFRLYYPKTTTKRFVAENDDCGRSLCERRDAFRVRRPMSCRAERAKFEIYQETVSVFSQSVNQSVSERCSSKRGLFLLLLQIFSHEHLVSIFLDFFQTGSQCVC